MECVWSQNYIWSKSQMYVSIFKNYKFAFDIYTKGGVGFYSKPTRRNSVKKIVTALRFGIAVAFMTYNKAL